MVTARWVSIHGSYNKFPGVLFPHLGIPVTKKKFAELELSLLHLQQNVEIPETHLIIHPVIQRVVEQARASGSRPNISDIPTKQLLTKFECSDS